MGTDVILRRATEHTVSPTTCIGGDWIIWRGLEGLRELTKRLFACLVEAMDLPPTEKNLELFALFHEVGHYGQPIPEGYGRIVLDPIKFRQWPNEIFADRVAQRLLYDYARCCE